MIELSKIYTVEQLKNAVSSTGSHFFDKDTMRFFLSRVAPGLIHTDNGIVFITSEQFTAYEPCYHKEPRRYTVRILKESGDIDDIGEFQQYATLRQARRAVKEYAEFVFKGP